jgi:hypothetical protein
VPPGVSLPNRTQCTHRGPTGRVASQALTGSVWTLFLKVELPPFSFGISSRSLTTAMRYICVFCKASRPDPLWGSNLSLLFNGYRGSVAGLKGAGRDVDHLPPSRAEVKDEWSRTSPSPLCLHCVRRDNFTLPLMFKRPLCVI